MYVSFLPVTGLASQKVLIKFPMSSLTFPLRFLFTSSPSFDSYPLLFSTLPKCLFSYQDASLLEKMEGTKEKTYWIFFPHMPNCSLLL